MDKLAQINQTLAKLSLKPLKTSFEVFLDWKKEN
jgi:hypothetical protein